MNRRHLLVLFLSVTLALATGVWLLLPPPSLITRDNASKNLHRGMTLVEIEQVLGGPARDEGGRLPLSRNFQPLREKPPSHEWATPEVIVQVWLDDAGQLHECNIIFSSANEDTLFNKILRWMRRQP